MNGKEYQELAMRTYDGNGTNRLSSFANTQKFYREEFLLNVDAGAVLNACLGLSGEVGEFNDMIKKWIFHEKPLDEEHLKKELGDIMWYIAMMCHAFNYMSIIHGLTGMYLYAKQICHMKINDFSK